VFGLALAGVPSKHHNISVKLATPSVSAVR
jgi:hypothetical protein